MLRALYLSLIAICILPILPGLLGVLVSAFGYIPPIGLNQWSWAGFAAVLQWQGVGYSIALTVFTTLASSYLACLICFAILQAAWLRPIWRKMELMLSPLLALPHVAFAIGFAFLFAPTGMVARAFEPLGLSGSELHDAALLVKDPYGLGLVMMLALKEVPFLLLMSMPILQQMKVQQIEKSCQSLGYSRAQTWLKCIFPQWLVKLRFAMLAIIAYSLSVVDVALIIGPTNPPTFAVLVWQWFNDPDLALLPRAAAGALMLFLLACLLIALVQGIEWLITKRCTQWQFSGRSGMHLQGNKWALLLVCITTAMIPLMLLWSFAQRWRFPDLLPSRFSLRFWQYEWDSIAATIENSLSIALVSATIALVFAIVAHEYRLRARWQLPAYVIALPMLIPQLSMMFGIQVMTLHLSSNAYFFWVCWSHLFFAFPLVYLSLDGPWRSFDSRLTQVALSLGKSPLQTWLKVKLPILLPALLLLGPLALA